MRRSGAALLLGLALLAGCAGEPVAAPTPPPVTAAPPATTTAPASTPPAVTPTPTVPPTPKPTPTRVAHRYVYPVGGRSGYAREHHDYPAADIIAACGSPVRAITDGVVLEVNRVDRWDAATDRGADRGGLYVSVLGDDGVRYYGAHLRSVEARVKRGLRVRAGERLGRVGDTGRAGACHLHLGLSPPCGRVGDWWVRRGVVGPWSYLDSWRAGGSRSPVSAVTAWRKANGCPSLP